MPNVTGNDSNNVFPEGTGDEPYIYTGLGGNDTYTLRLYNDTIYPPYGEPTVVYLRDQAIEAENGGKDRVYFVNHYNPVGFTGVYPLGTVTAAQVANIEVIIGVNATRVVGNTTYLIGWNITAGGINNEITTYDANDFVDGGAGNDIISTGAGDDRLVGGDGNDRLDGGDGFDEMEGGAGNDTYVIDRVPIFGVPGFDRVIEAPNGGNDTVLSEKYSLSLASGRSYPNIENLGLLGSANLNLSGNDLVNVLTGNGANNYLYGNGGNDTLDGGAGDDVLVGGAGADTMSGGTGNDTYAHDNGDIIIEAVNAGTDLVKSSAVSCTLTANVENLTLTSATNANGAGNSLGNTLTGNNAANYLYGFDGNDRLYGVAGDDVLIGGNGNDVIYGGAGKDTLVGGANADYFDFKNISESAVGANRDVITDFSHAQGDRINLAQIDANTSVAGDQAFTYIGSAAFTAAGQVRYANGIVEVNVDAGLGADMQIQLTGAPALVSGDFVL